MKWFSALLLGSVLGVFLPMIFGGREGLWTDSWAGWGTFAPFSNSPGLLFSIPVAIITAIIFRIFFNWHSN